MPARVQTSTTACKIRLRHSAGYRAGLREQKPTSCKSEAPMTSSREPASAHNNSGAPVSIARSCRSLHAHRRLPILDWRPCDEILPARVDRSNHSTVPQLSFPNSTRPLANLPTAPTLPSSPLRPSKPEPRWPSPLCGCRRQSRPSFYRRLHPQRRSRPEMH